MSVILAFSLLELIVFSLSLNIHDERKNRTKKNRENEISNMRAYLYNNRGIFGVRNHGCSLDSRANELYAICSDDLGTN